MINKQVNNNSGGIGFLGLLAIVFITLKLTEFIDWSWWWVTAPLWVIPALLIVIGIIWFLNVVRKHYKAKRAVAKARKEMEEQK